MLNFADKPIMIVSSPRTGSTALITTLAFDYKLRLFAEPSRDSYTFAEFNSFRNQSNNWIAKELVRDYIKNYKGENKNYSLTRLRRKDVTKQILSMYISIHRNKWSYIQEDLEQFKQQILPKDQIVLDNQISFTLRQNKYCDELTDVDYDLYYEDVLPNFATAMSPTPYPANYEELYNWVNEHMRKQQNDL